MRPLKKGKIVKFAKRTATKIDIARARALRRGMSKAERILWKKLREFPPESGLTFRRQHPVHPYVLDFACIKIKLAVEIDRMSHDNRQTYDHKRDLYLMKKGYVVIRFANEAVLNNIDSIMETINREAGKLVHTKALHPWGEGWAGGSEAQQAVP
ncbi:MAG: DUF559 domain-containing protein [Alphaproteobacteria bacterium]|nr:DUF559 domain-containing protein [Alphaproteobacteria bacterium]